MKVLLVLQRFNVDPYVYNPTNKCVWNYLLPIGLPYLSAVLKNDGHTVKGLNLNQIPGKETDIIKVCVLSENYDAVLLGGLSLFYPHIRDYITTIRKADPRCKIIVGGGIITAQPKIMFGLLKPDFTVIGEGEKTVRELIEYLHDPEMWQNIDGIGYEKDGIYRQTRDRDSIKNLDNLPFPDFDLFGYRYYLNRCNPLTYTGFDIEDHPRPYPILASRSCPFDCTFCFHPIGKIHRRRSIENIMEEIREAIPKYRINILIFYDETITPDKVRMIELCRQIKEFARTIPWKLHWIGNIRVNSTDEETIKVMSESGCHMVSTGLESYSQKVLDSMNKRTSPAEINMALTTLAKYHIAPQGTFIFGDPAETFDTARTTLDFYIHRQDIIRGAVGLGFIIPFQGSALYKYCVRTGIIPDEIDFIKHRAKYGYQYTEPMNLTNMNDKDFAKLADMVLTAHHIARSAVTGKYLDGKVSVVCPYCGETSEYKGVDRPSPLLTIGLGCRHCNGRFELVPYWYPVKKFLFEMFGYTTLYRIKKMIKW
jgi:anaerobic magnesium-protoporphyrin IX monomethyl ester cyclase